MDNLEFKFHLLEESDLPLMCEWLNLPHLQEWWREGEITLDAVREKYLPRINNKDTAIPYLAYLNGKPEGFIQYYSVTDGNPNWWPDKPGPGVYGIDTFIGKENKLNKGLGTAMVKGFLSFLFNELSANEVRVDPRPDNFRAIRCYEKAGFRQVQPITNPDGPAIMMVVKKAEFLQ